jgi:aminoglycoside phosphotransferase
MSMDSDRRLAEVLYFGELDETEYLLMTETLGHHCADRSLKRAREEIMGSLARGLRMINDVDILECPFYRRLERGLQRLGH